MGAVAEKPADLNSLIARMEDIYSEVIALRRAQVRSRRATMTLEQVADEMNRAKSTVSSQLSRDPGHWLHACSVRGERGLYHTHMVLRHLGGESEGIQWDE